MKKILTLTITLLLSLCLITPAWACGMLYIPVIQQADIKLYNKTSQVILARYDNKTVLTLSTDYQGDVKDFAMVVPVPVVLTADQVKIGEPSIFDKLNDLTAPQLIEYSDEDPCANNNTTRFPEASPSPSSSPETTTNQKLNQSLGVTIEERFTVGEYDILILSAQQSDGLETWLRENNYAIPQGASKVLSSYIRQNMKFFVAKVNLTELNNTGYQFLSPLVMSYDSPKFMLPLRLGMINAKGEQDLMIYLLSPKGRAEVTNYRTVEVTSRVDVPEFINKEFGKFYSTLLTKDYERENKNVALLEYANQVNYWTPEELKQTGVFWVRDIGKSNVFITRLHVRYTRDKFPEDLNFQETSNQQFFCAVYTIHHPYRAKSNCSQAYDYSRSTRIRQNQEAQTLAKITGWDIHKIRAKIDFVKINYTSWWRYVWIGIFILIGLGAVRLYSKKNEDS